jgi:RNA polymerase sigma-70 factor (ECF subfamily)
LKDDLPRNGETTLELVHRARKGDAGAQAILVERLYPRLTAFAHAQLPRRARSLKDTGDLVHEAILRTLANLHEFEPQHSGSLYGYLCRSVRNLINDEVRRVHRRPSSDGTVSGILDSRPSQVEEAIGSEHRALYEQAYARLSETDRTAIHLRHELDLSYREIAEALGKPSPDAARVAVNRATVRLASLLEAAGV